MAYEHEKSGVTILFDIFRHLLIFGGTVYVIFLIWRWNWIVALIAILPVYMIMLNLFGFLTLPLYAFTPENKLKAKAFNAFQNGDVEKGKELTDEFADKFNVNIPDDE